MCQFMKALLSIHGAEREFMAKPIHAESQKLRYFDVALFHFETQKKLRYFDAWQERLSVLALGYYEVTNASRSGGEKASAEHQIKVRQSLASTQNRQATSGIMRGLSLMCESRVCPLCEANEGKHVRKGWLYT